MTKIAVTYWEELKHPVILTPLGIKALGGISRVITNNNGSKTVYFVYIIGGEKK